MAGGGDPRESATESIPPDLFQVRVKGCGKSAPRAWQQVRHGKPHREQNQIGMVGTEFSRVQVGFPNHRPGWLLEMHGNMYPR
jgi:hypothetical protein